MTDLDTEKLVPWAMLESSTELVWGMVVHSHSETGTLSAVVISVGVWGMLCSTQLRIAAVFLLQLCSAKLRFAVASQQKGFIAE